MANLVGASGWGFSGTDWLGSAIATSWARDDSDTAAQRDQAAVQKQMDYSERMSNTAWQRGTADMKAAGINPMLAFQQGGASSPTGSTYQAQLPHSGILSAGVNEQIQTQQAGELMAAQADKAHADADAVRAQNPVTIDSLRQTIAESKERIDNLKADTNLKATTAAQAQQQTENLKAQIPLIKADIAKTIEQAKNFASNTNLQTEEAKYQRQVVEQSLPALQRANEDLQRKIAEMSLPGHMANEAAQDSFIGLFGAYLRALLPIQGIMGAIPIGRNKTVIQKAPPVNIKIPRSFGQ